MIRKGEVKWLSKGDILGHTEPMKEVGWACSGLMSSVRFEKEEKREPE
jgi:hypothetical protein